MAFAPSFESSQIIGLPMNIVLTDDSSGSDGTISSRRIYITDYNGNSVVPPGNANPVYILWPYANSTITLTNILPTQDMAFFIQVDWLNVSNAVLYSETKLQNFTLYSESFYYSLTQQQTGNPSIIQDTSYYNNKMILRCSIDESSNAVLFNDISSAQSALNRAAFLIANENNFF